MQGNVTSLFTRLLVLNRCSICYSCLISLGSTDSSVGRALDSLSQGHKFDPQSGRCVVSFSKTLHPHCLVLVKPRKPSLMTKKLLTGT